MLIYADLLLQLLNTELFIIIMNTFAQTLVRIRKNGGALVVLFRSRCVFGGTAVKVQR